MNDIVKEILQNYDTYPVPVVKIANEKGIDVYATSSLKSNESGLIRKEGDKFIIYVNKNHPQTRQRFTIAHELGHFVLHPDKIDSSGDSMIQYTKQYLGQNGLQRADGIALTPERKKMEKEANEFAAELLMPEAQFKDVWKKSSSIEEIAQAFNVSTYAANIRGKTLLGEYFFE
jgi:Zn-dependent peptidase ImmA (M78 family)